MSTRTYTATEQVYLSKEGQMVYPGEKFTVDAATPTAISWLDENGDPIPEHEKVRKPEKAGATATATAATPTNQAGMISISDLVEALRAAASASVDPLDHDGDGRKGGSRSRKAKAASPAGAADYTTLSSDELKAEAGKRAITVDGLDDAQIIEALRADDADG